MDKTLLKMSYEFKVPYERDIDPLIEEHKEKTEGLITYRTVYKTKKEQGEIVDDWYIVTITHIYKV